MVDSSGLAADYYTPLKWQSVALLKFTESSAWQTYTDSSCTGSYHTLKRLSLKKNLGSEPEETPWNRSLTSELCVKVTSKSARSVRSLHRCQKCIERVWYEIIAEEQAWI